MKEYISEIDVAMHRGMDWAIESRQVEIDKAINEANTYLSDIDLIPTIEIPPNVTRAGAALAQELLAGSDLSHTQLPRNELVTGGVAYIHALLQPYKRGSGCKLIRRTLDSGI